MPINPRKNKDALRTTRTGYNHALNLFGRHLKRIERKNVREKMLDSTTFWQSSDRVRLLDRFYREPVRYYPFFNTIALSERNRGTPDRVKISDATHEGTHYLVKNKIINSPENTLLKRFLKFWKLKEDFATAGQVLSEYFEVRRKHSGKEELKDATQRFITYLENEKKRAQSYGIGYRLYVKGFELGLKAVRLCQEHHSRAGIWFLYFLSRGYSEERAILLAISFKK